MPVAMAAQVAESLELQVSFISGAALYLPRNYPAEHSYGRGLPFVTDSKGRLSRCREGKSTYCRQGSDLEHRRQFRVGIQSHAWYHQIPFQTPKLPEVSDGKVAAFAEFWRSCLHCRSKSNEL